MRAGMTTTARRAPPVRGASRAAIGCAVLGVALLATSCSGADPGGAAASRLDTAWVATDASVALPGTSLTAVDLRRHAVEARVSIGSLPSAMAFTPDGSDLLAVTQGDDMLHEIDPVAQSVVRSLRVGVEPDAVAVAPGGSGQGIALVANLDSNSVTAVDLGTWRVETTFAVGSQPVAIAVTTVAGHPVALVADFGSNQVTPLYLSTKLAGPPIAVGPGPETIAAAPGEALVGNFTDHSLTPISLATMQSGAAVALPVDPTGIAVTPSGTTAYVCGGASVIPVTLAGLSVAGPITLPAVAQALALGAAGTTAWVALGSGDIVSVALPSGVVGTPIHLGGHPSAVVLAGR
jgi:YVTN family beta-propeller protein